MKKHAATFDKPGWEDNVHEDPEVLLQMHRLLDYWRSSTGQERVEETASETEAEPERAKPERVVKEWLLKQSYSTKLACVMMENFGIDDHGTKELWEEIIRQFETDIEQAANTTDESLTNEERLMTGVALELGIWRSHY